MLSNSYKWNLTFCLCLLCIFCNSCFYQYVNLYGKLFSFSFWCNHFDVQVLTVSQSKSSQLEIVQIAIYLHQSICPTWVAMYLALFMVWCVSAKKILFWKKKCKATGFWIKVRSFPIDLTPLLKNFFRKNFLVNFLRRQP